MAIIKIQTNIPIFGTPKYADYAPSKTEGWAAQVKLKGNWDGAEPGSSVYVPIALADEMMGRGVLECTGDDQMGNPAYKVIGQPRIQILRGEKGGKKFTTFEVLSVGSAPSSPPANRAPAPAHNGRQAASPPSNGRPPQNSVAPSAGEEFKRRELLLMKCLDSAHTKWRELAGAAPTPFDCVYKTAYSLFQACLDANLLPSLPPKPAPESMLKVIEGLGKRLEWSEDKLQAECQEKLKGKLSQITKEQADWMMRHINTLIHKKEEEARRAAEPEQGDAYEGDPQPSRAPGEDIPF